MNTASASRQPLNDPHISIIMIRVELSTEPLIPGERRELRASEPGELSSEAAAPMSVVIECFVEPPTPAALKLCASCGEFEVTNGELFHPHADPELFQGGGFLKVTIGDAAGEKFGQRLSI